MPTPSTPHLDTGSTNRPQLEDTLAIEARGIQYDYRNIPALKDFDLSLAPGEKVALLGANGAGKSTFFRLLAGQQRLQKGTLKLFDAEPGSLKARHALGVAPQNSGFPQQLKLKELLHWMSLHHQNAFSSSEMLQLLEALEMDQHLNRYLRQFSGGQQRKVALILALLSQPRLILLDEPTTGLDVRSRRQLLEWLKMHLKTKNVALLFSTHHLEEVEALADRVLLLQKGTLIGDGSLSQIKSQFGGYKVRFRCKDADQLKVFLQSHQIKAYEQNSIGQWQLEMTEADHFVRQLVAEKISFSQLEVVSDSLEDIFLRLNHEGQTS